MNRRDFLRRAAMLAGQLTVDPEFLLWTPKPMITVPALTAVDVGCGPSYSVLCHYRVAGSTPPYLYERRLTSPELTDYIREYLSGLPYDPLPREIASS